MMEKIPAAVFAHLLCWWERLEEDRASRAILKRAHDINAVALSVPYQCLYRELLAAGWPVDERPEQSLRNDRLAAVVGLLAHVRGEVNGTRQRNGTLTPPKAMSRKEADRPVVSELRFLRLLQSPDTDSLFIGLRRLLPLMGNSLDVIALATDLLNWGDKVRKQWAYHYDWPEQASR